MKVLIAKVNAANANCILASVRLVSEAFATLSPRSVRDRTREFLGMVEELGLTTCILAEDEWAVALTAIRKEHSEFCAEFILSEAEVAMLSQMNEKLPLSFRHFTSVMGTGESIVCVPIDEEVLDGLGK